ncbi:MAG: DUF6642 family protein [candidate division WOR-3 bacterium]
MPRLYKHKKNIVCLEGNWNKPILKVISEFNNVKFIHRKCSKISSLKKHLDEIKSLKSYDILYLNFHGKKFDLEELAEYMKSGFKNKIVHFGSCSTLNVGKNIINNFMEITGVSMVLGYREDVMWTEATALFKIIKIWVHFLLEKLF